MQCMSATHLLPDNIYQLRCNPSPLVVWVHHEDIQIPRVELSLPSVSVLYLVIPPVGTSDAPLARRCCS